MSMCRRLSMPTRPGCAPHSPFEAHLAFVAVDASNLACQGCRGGLRSSWVWRMCTLSCSLPMCALHVLNLLQNLMSGLAPGYGRLHANMCSSLPALV